MASTWLLILLIVLTAGLLLAGGLLLYIYWWLIQRCTPALDGVVTLACLEQPVEIRRDKHGIPHLVAQSRADLWRGQGFVHAQDRLWQMEQGRRMARGALAELFGEAALEADRFSRVVGFWRAAQSELTVTDPQTLAVLTWYAEGVNAYLALRPGRLAAEFNLLRSQPAPWTPLDILGYAKVLQWSMSINWESELARLQLLQQLDALAAAEAEPDYPSRNPLVLEGVGSAELMRLRSTAGLLLHQYEAVKQWLGGLASGQGSNSWVVAPKASLNRRPLLACDPHLAVSMPNLWYENHLSAPGLRVSGASIPGLPGVLIGHNEQIAWGMTNALVDTQDLYVERVNPANPLQVEQKGEWAEALVMEERIHVRRRPLHLERVVITPHGPLLSGLLSGQSGAAPALAGLPAAHHLALRWTGHIPGQSIRAILRLNEASDWSSFCLALADWSLAPQNFTYADSNGNIGYLLAGQIPVRDKNLGLAPAPGWSGQAEWNGFIPAEQLPRLYNPPSGKIVTANNKLVGDDYPYFLGVEFDPGWRAARLEELLTEKERYTLRDMEAMQLDTLSKYAQALTPWLTWVNRDDPWLNVGLTALRKWNFHMDAESSAPTIFHYTLVNLLEMVFGDKLGSGRAGFLGVSENPLFRLHGFWLHGEQALLTLLDQHEQSAWYMDVRNRRTRTREELLEEALTRAIQQLRQQAGDSSRLWGWGRLHQVRYVHALGSVGLFRNLFNRGPFPVSGDATTPHLTRHAPQLPLGLVQVAAGYRQLYEVGAWERAQSVTSIGQSGHPLSKQYDDQIILWREGVYHTMPWSKEAVEQATVYLLELRPKGWV